MVKQKISPKGTENFETKFEQIQEALCENYCQQKFLMNELKELMALHKKEIKLSSKCINRSESTKKSSFNKLEPIPLSLKNLLQIDDDHMTRSQITKLIYQYFTHNKMYNETNKKEIIPNNKIRKIFGMSKDDVLNFYNFQTWLKKVYDDYYDNNLLITK